MVTSFQSTSIAGKKLDWQYDKQTHMPMTVLNKIRLTDEGKLKIMVLSSFAIKLNKSALESYIICKERGQKKTNFLKHVIAHSVILLVITNMSKVFRQNTAAVTIAPTFKGYLYLFTLP